ncbi:acetate--CoA ligase family protein (plasmid) [Sinorhizobium garamanticum]|uniref:Acetate--CoA ligase family protein n=1 Tax=Sinorhizobium garamanticum TaxID=680247 RepID=A0ABY8DL37_9HYPH|nr:acetate--CoA ligase family protein [Sinorhizobium garamanticum]WEX91624.1 acetate--CoA ligase family protein [Sinorhizobium garamanticum]
MNIESQKLSQSIDGLFNPCSVALVGASSTTTKWGFAYARQLLAGASRRRIHLINQRGETILGQQSYTSLRSLPETPELAVICVPAPHVRQAINEALAIGTRYLVCITAGFGEIGEEGRRQQNELRDRIRSAGARLVGPNCVGLYDAAANLECTAFWKLAPGDIGIISQSGSVVVDLGARLPRENLGISRAVSLGNQADLTVEEFVEAFALDPNTRVIVAYVEEFRDGRRMFEAIERARQLGKEVVLVAPRAGEAVRRSVTSHTGSMISNEDVLASLCADLDVVRVRGMGDLFLALRCLSAPVRALGRRVAVIADGGGFATLGTDSVVEEGLEVPAFSPALRAKLTEIMLPGSGASNPIDYVGALDLASFKPVISAIASSGEVDAILLNGAYNDAAGAAPESEAAVATDIRETCQKHGIGLSVATMITTEPAMVAFAADRVPVCDFPAEAARLLALGRIRKAKRQLPKIETTAAYLGETHYISSRDALAAGGIAFTRAIHARDSDEAAIAANKIGYPVVLKALGILHKSDSGAVVLEINDEATLRAKVETLTGQLNPTGFSVEEMIVERDGVELLIGGLRDPAFGPTVVVAAGGTKTEIWRDRVVALAPVSEGAARRMLSSLRIAPLFAGFRGRPPLDLSDVTKAVAAISRFISDHHNVLEAEINPLIVGPTRCIAVDARIVAAR